MQLDGNSTITISLVLSLLTMTVMFGRWQGRLDIKLDHILDSFKTIKDDIDKLFEEVNKLHTRVTVLEDKRKRSTRGSSGE